MRFLQITKRISLFVVVNALVMTTIIILLSLLNVPARVGPVNFIGLLIFCLLFGMGGSVVSLLMSRAIAKWTMRIEIIDPDTTDLDGQRLVQTVYRLARTAGLSHMPEVGVYDSPEINAFATGPSESRALVAVSSGLLGGMRQGDVEGVLGHEIAHVANGDMVTMTLIQGIVNAIAMFLAYVLAIVLSQNSSRDDDRGGGGNWFMRMMLVQVFQNVFMVLGFIVVAWFSRQREFRADAGGAQYAGREHMLSALKRLRAIHDEGLDQAGEPQPAVQALKISGKTGTVVSLFATHPPIEERIARLENAATA